ncbi:plastocyanin/azurin family copper-binding protein [Salinilacihabitans rarus]|uniref:plastocyanin/azurin family copper-binding protein n=1 Tax=Salinilacihabitans rarus TaxID=2961596 RepID=UPI0020C8F7C8|nr:plastocyanin/azurin family copper-binding protein [Salinilacihabitans rarus]
MRSPETERPDDSFDEPITDWFDFERRPLLKSLGAGVALSLGSGLATARGDDHAVSTAPATGGSDAGGIDPQYGFAVPDVEEIPESLVPDHEVELHTEEPEDPENPDRPPFFHFDPVGIHVSAGDVVQFTSLSPDHTITAYHPAQGFQQRVPDGVPPFSSPVLTIGSAWLYEFTEPGVYDVYCGPHHVLGMSMRIVVGDLAADDLPEYADTFEGSDEPPLLAPFSKAFLEHELNATTEGNEDCEWAWLTPQEILDAPALDPATVRDRGTVPFADVLADIDRFADELPDHDEADETAPTVQIRDHAEYGEILVDSDEMTLYMFDQDTQGAAESACYDDCADAWPPLTADAAVAGDDVTADLRTFERETGETQVTANGWPLYLFARDDAPGDVRGQGSNGVWWVLGPDGTPIRSEPND